MSEGSKRSAPQADGPNKALRTGLHYSTLASSQIKPPPNDPAPTDPVDKEIYVLQLRERLLLQEAAKVQAEERLLKARMRIEATRAAKAAEEDEMSASLDSIRSLFGSISIPDKYLKQIYHDKFDPKNIIRLSPPLKTYETTNKITALKEYGSMSASLDSIRSLFGSISIPDKYLKQIYHDKFDPKNIIRLSPPLKTYETTNKITALKEYGSTTAHWSRAFNVYGAILCSFFALQNPSLPLAIFHFGWQIEMLAESFSWQEACLPLAITALERVRTQGRFNPSSWDIPQLLVAHYCRWDRLRETSRGI
ncbi:hypothetical protein V8E54_000279 [Elaphomyces granulatus]